MDFLARLNLRIDEAVNPAAMMAMKARKDNVRRQKEEDKLRKLKLRNEQEKLDDTQTKDTGVSLTTKVGVESVDYITTVARRLNEKLDAL